jgi:hypothetical protein
MKLVPLRVSPKSQPYRGSDMIRTLQTLDLVENFFCCLKAFRRIATRNEKTDTCFAAMIDLVAIVL